MGPVWNIKAFLMKHGGVQIEKNNSMQMKEHDGSRGTTPAGRALPRPKALRPQAGFEPPTTAPMGDRLTTRPGEDVFLCFAFRKHVFYMRLQAY